MSVSPFGLVVESSVLSVASYGAQIDEKVTRFLFCCSKTLRGLRVVATPNREK